MRDAKILQIYEGTSQIQRVVIAREVLIAARSTQPDRSRRVAFAPTGECAFRAAPRLAGRAASFRRAAPRGPFAVRMARHGAGEQVQARAQPGGRAPRRLRTPVASKRRRPRGHVRRTRSPVSCAGARCCRCSCSTTSPRARLRQPADGADRRPDRGRAVGEPEHDVPAAARSRGPRADRGQLGAPRPAQPPLLRDHRRGARGVRRSSSRRCCRSSTRSRARSTRSSARSTATPEGSPGAAAVVCLGPRARSGCGPT